MIQNATRLGVLGSSIINLQTIRIRTRLMASRRRIAYVVLVLVIFAASAFFVPISHPTFDICPHSSLVSDPYVSLSYLLFRYGAVYFIGHGFFIWLNPNC